MIPRVIHYCWFGNQDKPAFVEKCIESWRNALPEYQIIEWNEANFDITSSKFALEAYQEKKFAFVSDVVRAYVLYMYGGIYLDTDVEVLKSFDELLHYRSFWGFEAGNFVATSTIGARPGNEIIKSYLDYYSGKRFVNSDGTYNSTTNVKIVTNQFVDEGLKLNNTQQIIGDMNIVLSTEYLSPYDYRIGIMESGAKTISIHYYSNSWDSSVWATVKRGIKNAAGKLIGKALSEKIWLKKSDMQ